MPDAAVFKPLTNRTTATGGKRFELPADGYIQLVPMGKAPYLRDNGTDEGEPIIQLVDVEALQSMYNRALAQGGEVLIDFEHFSHESDKPTDAAAWQPYDADHLQLRDDGLYGKPRWSDDGETAVTGGRLRYISPEFPNTDTLLVNVSGKIFRPLAVTGFGLTNRPGFKRHSKPLTNSDRRESPADKPQNHMHKALLATALSLSETDVDKLDEPTLRNRVQALKDQAASAAALGEQLKTLHNREADAFIEKHDKVIPTNEVVRKHLKETFLTNRAAAEGIVAGYADDDDGMTPAERSRAERKPLHNRQQAEPPKADQAAQRKEEVLAGKRSARATDLMNRESGLRWNDAFNQACREITE